MIVSYLFKVVGVVYVIGVVKCFKFEYVNYLEDLIVYCSFGDVLVNYFIV